MKITSFLFFVEILKLLYGYKTTDYKSQIINIQSVETRSLMGQRQLYFNAFGKKYFLELEPNSVLAPDLEIFEASFASRGKTKLHNLGRLSEADLGDGLYSVRNVPGSVFVSRGQRGVQVEGFIDNFYVKPTILKSGLFREQTGTHVAFQMPKTSWLYDKDTFEDRKLARSFDVQPQEVVVEILAVMDHKNSKRMNFDKKQITKFLAVEYGAVQRIYNVFQNPAIKFRVAKIFINKNKSAEPYINNNMVDNQTVESNCLDDFGDWAYALKGIPSIDVAFLHMDYFIYDKESKMKAMGLAHIGYACSEGAGMAKNEAPYHLGYLTVAHELGHLLNSHHDGHWTSKQCPFVKGNLMGSDQFDSLKYIPSECTFQRIQEFLRSENSSCLRSTSDGLISATQVFPGDVMSNDMICQQKLGPDYFAKQWFTPDMCSRPLYCCNGPGKANCQWMDGMEVLEGTPCGFSMFQHQNELRVPRPIFTNKKQRLDDFAGFKRPKYQKYIFY